MIPFVSGAKVASVALSGLGKTYELASVTAELPGRAMTVLDDVEAMVTRVGVLVGRMERIAGQAAKTTAEAARTAAEAAVAVEQAKALNLAAAAAVAGAAKVTAEAAALLRTYEPIAAKAAPLAERFVDSLSPEEVDAAITLVDELPRLTEHLRSDIMPILATLDRVGPDVHELLEVTYDVRRAILGIPGFGFFKKRGEDILEEEEQEAHDRDGSAP